MIKCNLKKDKQAPSPNGMGSTIHREGPQDILPGNLASQNILHHNQIFKTYVLSELQNAGREKASHWWRFLDDAEDFLGSSKIPGYALALQDS